MEYGQRTARKEGREEEGGRGKDDARCTRSRTGGKLAVAVDEREPGEQGGVKDAK